MKENYVYKIRRKSDGLFSTGGMRPTFNTIGKAWKNLGNLKNHLGQQVRFRRETEIYDDCETVKYRVSYEEVGQDLDIPTYIEKEKQKRYY